MKSVEDTCVENNQGCFSEDKSQKEVSIEKTLIIPMSPLTTEQENFFKENENNSDFLNCYKELEDNFEISDQDPFSADSDSSWGPTGQQCCTSDFSNSDGTLAEPLSPCKSNSTQKKNKRRRKNKTPYKPQTERPINITGSNESESVGENSLQDSVHLPQRSVSPNSKSNEEETSQNQTKKSRKRMQNKLQWKRNVAKSKRFKGEEYQSAVSKTGKTINEKKLKPPCSDVCKMKCNTITEARRQLLCDAFWKTMSSWEQRRQFIASSITLTPVMRPRIRNINEKPSRRKNSRNYYLKLDDNSIRVCQTMFLNTFVISEQFVTTTLSKFCESSNIVNPDQRGKHVPANKTPAETIEYIKKHILSFPRYTSHYSRSRSKREYLGPELNVAKMYSLFVAHCKAEGLCDDKISKEWLYRKTFNEEFNLAFYLPSNDTCDTCDKFESILRHEANLEEKAKIEKIRSDHLKDADERYARKRRDKESSKNSNGKSITLMLDMQKCLPTPLLTNTQSFYLRKLWVLNETLHDDTSNKSYCMIWDETEGARGPNEVGSTIIEWVLNYMPPSTREITIWSDNCAGQNRNIFLVYCYFWLLENSELDAINHKFLLRGHTHSEVDAVHSVIERKKKELSSFEIAIPRDWEQLIRTCRPKNPMIVHRLNLNNIRNVKSLSTNFSQRRKNIDDEPFLISQCVWLQVRKNCNGILFYKTDFESETFNQIDLRRNTRQKLSLPNIIPPAAKTLRPISTAKYKDLVTLTGWISDPLLKSYYVNLPHGNNSDALLLDDIE